MTIALEGAVTRTMQVCPTLCSWERQTVRRLTEARKHPDLDREAMLETHRQTLGSDV